MAKVELKQPIIDAISADIKDAQGVVLVDYRGLTVEQDTELRKQLREAGIVYKVYKNTLMKRAFEGTEFAGLGDCLAGPSAIAISKEDATAPARLLAGFAKNAPALEFKGGVVEGNVYDQAGMIELSKVPSREALLSKLLGSLQSPMANLARVIDQIAEKGGAVAAVPADEVSAEAVAEAPAEEAPAEVVAEAPAEETPAEATAEAPAAEAPAEAVAEAPAEEAPAEAVVETPAVEVPAEAVAETPAEEAPAEAVAEAPVDEEPEVVVAEETPVEAAAEEAPAEVVAEEAPVEVIAEEVAEAPAETAEEVEEVAE